MVYITENLFEVNKFKNINDICSRFPIANSYIIDIPIGLVENKRQVRQDLIVKKNQIRKAQVYLKFLAGKQFMI